MNHNPVSQLYRPYLPAWLVERLGSDELQPGIVHTGDATILYADLSGFTRLTAAFAGLPDGAERLHDTLDRCYSALIETIAAYGGDVASIAGDALTAWWPGRREPEAAQRCAAAMLAVVAGLPVVSTPAGPFRLDLRIGLSVDTVHIALAGMPSHGVYLVISGPALDAATMAERTALPGAFRLAESERSATLPSLSTPPHTSAGVLSWEHFLAPGIAERLRQGELSAEYRRCAPVFAAFDLPARPEELHALVAQVQAVVLRWGGWLNEIEIGDKGALFVLLFGAPLTRGDDASRAVGCCLELRDRGLINRAGVTFGVLFVGAVGGQQRRVYTAQGDDMNLAAHLMQRAAQAEILVSGRVRHEVLGRYLISAPTLVSTKGHAEGVPVARVLAAGPYATRGPNGRQLPDATAPVGRIRERQALGEAAGAALDGQSSLIIVEGESGVGKSCLLQDLIVHWVEGGHVCYSGGCSSGGQSRPLQGWQTMLADLCGVDERATLRGQRAQLERSLRGLPAPLRSAGPLASRVLHLDGPTPLASSAEELGDTTEIEALVLELVGRRLANGPLLLVLEDIQWADEPSLRLIAALFEAASAELRYPLCVALSHRPLDEMPAPLAQLLQTQPSYLHLQLGPFSSAESLTMLKAQLGVSDIHPGLLQHVERHSEGQPLFIKEYLRVLQLHQLVQIEDDSARLARSVASIQLGNTALGLVQARVDRLDAPTRVTLKTAAVLGRSFSFNLLATVHPARPSAATLRVQLAALARLEIIELELDGLEPIHRFKHAVIHEVAYTSLLFGQRRQLHAAVARWYEGRYASEIGGGEAAMAVYEVLIDHLGRAEERERQSFYCQVAAEQAARQFATAAALRQIEQALTFAAEPARRFALLLLRVAVNERVGDLANQADDLSQLDVLAAQLAGAQPRAYTDYFQLRYLLAIGMYHAVLNTAPTIIKRLRRSSGWEDGLAHQRTLLQAGCIDALGSAQSATGDLRAARALHRQALRLCWQSMPFTNLRSLDPLLDAQSLAARCTNGLGAAALTSGQLSQALRLHRQALALARAAGDWSAETRARERVARVYLARGEREAALVELRAALATSHAVGDRAGQALAMRQLATISAASGDYAEAQRYAYHAQAISAGTRARVLEADLLEDIAGFAAAQGLDDEAEAAHLEAEQLRRQWWGGAAAATRTPVVASLPAAYSAPQPV